LKGQGVGGGVKRRGKKWKSPAFGKGRKGQCGFEVE